MLTDKDIEKQNFLSWYCMYATPDDIRMAKTSNNPVTNRLLNEYSCEIERINMSRNLHEEVF
ncbi:MAG: hypothetical protein ACE5GV_02815 [Candidatus Scalindua sp.]